MGLYVSARTCLPFVHSMKTIKTDMPVFFLAATGVKPMLETLVTSYTMGGMIHILLVIAIVVVLVRVFQGRR